LFGDIITDLAAAVTGGIGAAASGNIAASGPNPSMFEPVHGSAPDIAGQGTAAPVAAILSVALLLQHLGREDEAGRIEDAGGSELAARAYDRVETSAVGDRIVAAVRDWGGGGAHGGRTRGGEGLPRRVRPLRRAPRRPTRSAAGPVDSALRSLRHAHRGGVRG